MTILIMNKIMHQILILKVGYTSVPSSQLNYLNSNDERNVIQILSRLPHLQHTILISIRYRHSKVIIVLIFHGVHST